MISANLLLGGLFPVSSYRMTASAIWTILSVLNYLIVGLIIGRILLTRRDSRGMMTWILALLLLPGLGIILFLLIGQAPIQRKVRRRHKHRDMIEPDLAKHTAALAKSYDGRDKTDVHESLQDLIRLATRVSDTVVTRGNNVTVYHDAERAFLTLSLAIEAAKSHVHLEYYIFADDDTGRAMRDLLIKKANQGIEVRLLIDAVGSWRTSRSFIKPLRQAGVRVAFFLPWGFTRRRFQLNCRNHRKLSLIDGTLGFFGSKNIADEYLGRRKLKFGPWRDTHLHVTGPCVAQLQEVFAEDWHFATKENISSDKYFAAPTSTGDKLVQIVASGPDRRAGVLLQLLNAAVSDARHSVCLLTPYFVPDSAMILALTSASYRGVRVQVLVPSRSDNWLVLWAGRSFYEELLEADVEIYEYDRGMLHSKEVIVDNRWAMVGSANMDVRSFRINFELTSLLYDEDLAGTLQTNFERLRDQAGRIQLHHLKEWSLGQRLAAGGARLATPIL